MPSILKQGSKNGKIFKRVLNLIITGMPSILLKSQDLERLTRGFKPYYNWNTFNTTTAVVVATPSSKF